MQTKRTLQTFVLLSALIFVGVASCNDVKEINLIEKAKLSDIVVVGDVVDLAECNSSNDCVATISVYKSLKGTESGNLSFRYRGEIPELDPECCKERFRYLFFLRKGVDGIYVSTNGKFGVYELGISSGED
jgi:hypothetical protein